MKRQLPEEALEYFRAQGGRSKEWYDSVGRETVSKVRKKAAKTRKKNKRKRLDKGGL